MSASVDISEGTRLKAGFTGKTYTVRKVEGGKVYVTGLPPVSLGELKRDIKNGKIEVLR